MNIFLKIFLTAGFLCVFPFFVFAEAPEILTWQDCVKEALEKNPDLISAKEKVIQAKEDKNISLSDFLPEISGQLSGKKSKSSSSDKTNTYSYSVSASQLLFDGFKTTSKIHSSSKLFKAQEYNYLVVSSDIRLNLKIAFSNLLRAQELISITEEIAERRKENLNLVNARYEAGREHKGAVLTAEADLAQAEFEVSQAKRNLILACRDLLKQMGRTGENKIKVLGSFDISEKEKAKPDFQVLAENTPFLKELINKKDSANFDLSAAKAEFFPEVYLNGSFGRSQSHWPPEDDSWSASVNVSLPVFEGSSRFAKVSKAESKVIQAESEEQSGRDSVIYTLEKTWKDFQDALETVSVKKKFQEAAAERAKIANAQYSSGLTDFDSWIIIEDNLVNAKKAYLDARRNLLAAEGYWIQAKGGILEYAEK